MSFIVDGLWDGVKGESMTRSVQYAVRWLMFNLQVRIRYTGEEYKEWFRSKLASPYMQYLRRDMHLEMGFDSYTLMDKDGSDSDCEESGVCCCSNYG